MWVLVANFVVELNEETHTIDQFPVVWCARCLVGLISAAYPQNYYSLEHKNSSKVKTNTTMTYLQQKINK